jgi:tetratricopeptide (TPR) repeat protein
MRHNGRTLFLLLVTLWAAGPALAAPTQRGQTDDEIRFWAARLQRDPYDYISPRKLAAAYLRKARECGDPSYYRRAEQAVRKSLAWTPDRYSALATLASVWVGQHRFREARELAERCVRMQPSDSFNYGTLGDAEVELGHYPAAAAAIQRMLALEPGLSAYARTAYQRELHGDRHGAIEMMRRAAEAADPQDVQSKAWCWTQLGDLSFKGGDLAQARRQYDSALSDFPDYYLALFGKARVAAAERKLQEAEPLLTRAIAVIPRPDFIAALGDLYALAGRKQQARQQYDLVVQIEKVNRAAGAPDARRLSLFYSNHDRDLATALVLARQEFAMRSDIYTCDALAWALYKNHRYAEAWAMAKQAMRLQTEDAGIFYHAGMIALRLPGQTEEGQRLLKRALAVNPYFDLRQAVKAREALAALAVRAAAPKEERFHHAPETDKLVDNPLPGRLYEAALAADHRRPHRGRPGGRAARRGTAACVDTPTLHQQ